MEYQYKVIISNRTIYKEFEIQPDMDKVKLGTGSSCEFRLNPENFFSELEIEFRKEGKKWVLECSDEIYISKGDMRKLYRRILHMEMCSPFVMLPPETKYLNCVS